MTRLLLLLFVVGCVTGPTEEPTCVYAERPNPYGYPGESIKMCVCNTGAVIPDECGGGIAATDSVYLAVRP